MWYIHTMEYYSALKKAGTSILRTTWMDLEDIMLNEVSVIKGQYWMISPVQTT